MDSENIRTALGGLQMDAESAEAWASLDKNVLSSDEALDPSEVVRLLGSAAARHRERGEWDAVARLFDLQARVAGTGPEAIGALAELARIRHDNLVDQDAADEAYRRLLELDPDHTVARAALRDSDEKRSRWLELASTYLAEADKAQDDVYRGSMLMRSAEMQLRYAGGSADLDAIIDRLTDFRRGTLSQTSRKAGAMGSIIGEWKAWETSSLFTTIPRPSSSATTASTASGLPENTVCRGWTFYARWRCMSVSCPQSPCLKIWEN